MKSINAEDFEPEVRNASAVKPVILDIWDPGCPPCLALAPKFAALGERYGDRIIFLKMNRAENREIMKTLALRGVPTIIFMSGGTEICGRLTGDAEATAENIEAAITKILAV